jgi:hypothetical protein
MIIDPHIDIAVAKADFSAWPKPDATSRCWFFEDPEAQKLLIDEAEEWLGLRPPLYSAPTPWARGSLAKGPGGGSDCVGLDQCLMRVSGAAPHFVFPRRKHDYSPHAVNKRVLKYLRGELDDPQSKELARIFAEFPIAEGEAGCNVTLLCGDLIVLKTGVDLWHLPVMLGPSRFVQCMYPDGVSEGDIGQPLYRDRLVTMFRARSLEARAGSDAEHRTD